MNKFIQFKGNKDCPKCKGKGYYYYDENHAQICELCCTHPEGFIELDKEYYPEMIGQEVCKFGCGFKRVKPTMKKIEMDYEKMIREVNEITQSDFIADMECKLKLHEKPDIFTQEEAQEMSFLLSKIYSIAHCVHCSACGEKYAIKHKLSIKNQL
jgi:hypothetical protein